MLCKLHYNVVLRTAGGHILLHYGEKLVKLKTKNGVPLTIKLHVADVRRPTVSVKPLVEVIGWNATDRCRRNLEMSHLERQDSSMCRERIKIQRDEGVGERKKIKHEMVIGTLTEKRNTE
eukprot:5943760-Amphidinium_carterae.1